MRGAQLLRPLPAGGLTPARPSQMGHPSTRSSSSSWVALERLPARLPDLVRARAVPCAQRLAHCGRGATATLRQLPSSWDSRTTPHGWQPSSHLSRPWSTGARSNESASHRVVGPAIETRPDLITPASLTLFRQLGCTKIQMISSPPARRPWTPRTPDKHRTG